MQIACLVTLTTIDLGCIRTFNVPVEIGLKFWLGKQPQVAEAERK